MKSQDYIKRIIEASIKFVEEAKAHNQAGLTDYHLIAESTLIPMLDLFFDTRLQNVNATEKKNYPAVDLIDREKRVAFQITSTTDIGKIRKTLVKFRDHNLSREYDTLYIYILTEKQNRYADVKLQQAIPYGFCFRTIDHVLDMSNLRSKLQHLPIEKLKLLTEIFERQFSDAGNPQLTLSAVQEGNEVGKKTGETVEAIAEMVRAMQSALPVDNTKIYAEQLEFIKQFRKDHKPQTALDMLLKYKAEHWGKIGSELRYKVLANLGTLLFELGKKTDGAKQLIELGEVDFPSVDRLAYLCLGYAILGMTKEFDAVFEEAKSLQPDHGNLWIAYIHIQEATVTASEIENSLPPSILEKPEILYALGEALIDRGEERGFEMLYKLVELDGGGIEGNWHALTMIECRRLQCIATVSKIALKQFTADEIMAIKKSRDVLATIWSYVSNTEFARAAWHIVINKGVANKILGDNLAAENDFEEAWRLSHDFFAFKDLFVHYIDGDRLEKAELLLQAAKSLIIGVEDRVDFATCEARLYSAQKRPEKAVEALSKRLDSVSEDDRLWLLDLITLTYYQCGDFGKALLYAQRIVAEFGNRPEGYLEQGICYKMLQRRDDALASLDCAFERATDTAAKPPVWYQLGVEYSSMELNERAIVCFEKIAAPIGFDEVHRKLILEYYHAEDFSKAIKLSFRATAIVQGDALANEILFRAYKNTGEIELAKEVLQNYLKNGIEDALDHFRLLGINFYNQIGEDHEAVKLILDVRQPERFNLIQRLSLAKQLIDTDEVAKGLDMAFDARLDYYREAQAHEMYISCYIGGKEQPVEILYPDEVKMDCAISLQDKAGEQQDYFLTDDVRYEGSAILRSDGKWTCLLIGKKIGESITMPNTYGVGGVLTITSIMNKHVYAFRESGRLLETIFSGETKMQFLKWKDDNEFAEINEFFKKLLLDSQQSRQDLFRLYESNPITIGMLGHRFSRNFIEMWFDFLENQETSLKCYTHDESNGVSNATAGQQYVIIDPIALLTNLILLSNYRLLTVLGDKCVVAQSAVTELRHYKKHLELSGPGFSLGVEEGELRKHERTQEATDNTIKMVDAVLSWCESNAIIKTPTKRTRKTRAYDVDIIAFVGYAFHDSVLLAYELNGALLSDDERLKSFALGQFNVDSFSSYQLGVHKANSGLITADEFSALSFKLMRANYAYIPVTGKGLWELFDESGFKLAPPFSRGVRGLRIMSEPYCAKSLVDFAKLLYLNINVSGLRDHAILYVLQEAKHNANYRVVKLLVLQMLEQEFYLMPNQKDEVVSLINSLPTQL